jgi:hypothetical protein
MLRRLLDRFNGVDPMDARLRLTRLPRDSREDRVARILTRLPLNTRGALVEAVADDLRVAEDDPFRAAPEVGFWRLAFYRRSAEQLVGSMVGDLLKEEPAARAR